jgi:threonine dehydratase
MEALDITDNEMAKTHARFLAGGRSATVKNERLYRFTFSERPGALKNFLTHIEDQPPWNIRLILPFYDL